MEKFVSRASLLEVPEIFLLRDLSTQVAKTKKILSFETQDMVWYCMPLEFQSLRRKIAGRDITLRKYLPRLRAEKIKNSILANLTHLADSWILHRVLDHWRAYERKTAQKCPLLIIHDSFQGLSSQTSLIHDWVREAYEDFYASDLLRHFWQKNLGYSWAKAEKISLDFRYFLK